MGKLEELMKAAGSHAAESVARRDAQLIHRESPPAPPSSNRLAGVSRHRTAAEIPTERIVADPNQPREEFDPEAIERLAASIKARGLLQPIRVRWDEGRGSYVVVCGERRWRAAQAAGLSMLSCVVTEGAVQAADILADQLVENLLREDLRPVEQAKAFRTLMDARGWSTRDLARELNIAQPSVVRALALLGLPGDVQDKIDEGSIPAAAGYELSKLEDAEAQRTVAAEVADSGLTVAETAKVVRTRTSRPAKGKGSKARKVTERTFRTSDGTKITIENRRGLDDERLLPALRELLGRLEDEQVQAA